MKLTTVAEHTVCLDLIPAHGNILDLGARDFGFTKKLFELGFYSVVCVEPDPDVVTTDVRIQLVKAAVWPKDLLAVNYVKFGNGTGNYLATLNESGAKDKNVLWVSTISIQTILFTKFTSGMLHLIKMDIEGSEIPVLLALTEPPAEQISVEFHAHTAPTFDGKTFEDVCAHLAQWYDLVFDDYSSKHGCGWNHWDCLFILKNLYQP